MTEYRRKRNSRVWHWMRTCSNWPAGDCLVVRGEPTLGEKCEECRRKQDIEETENPA